ncbi:DUF2095 domain-containing protein [Candidatus Bathyarchaeota archaeon]|jgi:hypothetical protein|nr:DUF2095 domain-containing protein [Candidatus Bathyarchaeota archaeon]
MEKEEFKKRFPTLAKEIEEGEGKAGLNFQVEKPEPKRKFAGYDPDIVDFLRRCNTEEEALEIIEYMKDRDEITDEEANQYLEKLKEEGLRSFGTKKSPGYYEKEG